MNKVIEEIAKELVVIESHNIGGRVNFGPRHTKQAEALYDRIEREFPADDIRGMIVEKVSKVLKDYNISHMDMCILRSVLMTQLKWIWKGTYDPAGDYPRKGGCPTCGGVGGKYDAEMGTEDRCEDCGGTGERQKGEQRKEQWRGYKRIFSGDLSVDMWDEINGAKTIAQLRSALYTVCCRLQDFESRVDNRRGTERRKGKS